MSQQLWAIDNTFELQVAAFRRKITDLARDGDVDSGIVVAALAEVLGMTAALLDRRDGTKTLNDRMGSFHTRILQAYERTRNKLETNDGSADRKPDLLGR